MFVFLRDSLPSPDKYSSPTDCLFCASLPPNFLPHEEDKPKAKCWIPGNLQGEHSTSEQSASSHPWYSAVGHYIIYFFLLFKGFSCSLSNHSCILCNSKRMTISIFVFNVNCTCKSLHYLQT